VCRLGDTLGDTLGGTHLCGKKKTTPDCLHNNNYCATQHRPIKA